MLLYWACLQILRQAVDLVISFKIYKTTTFYNNEIMNVFPRRSLTTFFFIEAFQTFFFLSILFVFEIFLLCLKVRQLTINFSLSSLVSSINLFSLQFKFHLQFLNRSFEIIRCFFCSFLRLFNAILRCVLTLFQFIIIQSLSLSLLHSFFLSSTISLRRGL